MPLETGTYISDLVSTNPAHTDSVGAADSHLRFIKSTLLASFSGVTGAVTATHTALNAAAAAVVAGTIAAIHALGTAALPSITFLGNLNTGIYSPGANQVAISTNGAQAFLVKADGSLNGGTGQLGIIGEPRLWLSNTLPAGNFAWLNGATVTVASNPVLFSMWGYAYGGNGTTTMGLPNFQDVVPIGRGTMGGASDPALVAGVTTVGTIVGTGTHTLAQAELPAIKPAITITDPGHSHTPQGGASFLATSTGPSTAIAGAGTITQQPSTATSTTGVSAALTSNLGSATPFSVVQPSIVTNWITLLG